VRKNFYATTDSFLNRAVACNDRSISDRRRHNLVSRERREFRIFEKITVVIGRRR